MTVFNHDKFSYRKLSLLLSVIGVVMGRLPGRPFRVGEPTGTTPQFFQKGHLTTGVTSRHRHDVVEFVVKSTIETPVML